MVGALPASLQSRIRVRVLRWLLLGAAMSVTLAAVGVPQAVAASTRRLAGAPPRVPRGAKVIGALPGTTRLPVTVTLEPRDPSALQSYAAGVSTPGSPLYHRFLSVSEFAARFAPPAAQVSGLRAALAAQGLTAGPLSANGLSFDLTAAAATLGRALHVSFTRYRLRSGRVAFVNRAPPAVPVGVAGIVQGVVGLDNLSIRKPAWVVDRARNAAPRGPAATPRAFAGAAAPCATASQQAAHTSGYTADQIASAYGLTGLYGQGDLGRGATVALLELEPYASSDIATYAGCYGIAPQIADVGVDGGATCPGQPSGCGIEATLDIEVLAGLAPQATQLVYEGPNSDQGTYDTYRQMITDDRAQVISTSWGLCELAAQRDPTYGVAAENTLFQEAAVQGQSIFAAAGDSGVDDCGDGLRPAVDDPASQPWVTGVGGTSTLATGATQAETVWNDGANQGATGGGVSALWPRPSYQNGLVPAPASETCGARGYACREVPDVSAAADEHHGYVVYHQGSGGWGSAGGTSAAAPTWAALTALADASPACAGTRVGFANPSLYQAAATAYGSVFNDITAGDNGYDGLSGFTAAPGYDLASGLGTPKATALAPALCRSTVAFDSSPGAERSPAGVAVTPVRIAAHSTAGGLITYSASNLPSGLTISPTGVISGTSTTLGTYQVTVRAADSSDYSSATRTFAWTITTRITLSSPGSPVSRAGLAARLQLRGSDSASQPIRFAAQSLPRGLSLNPSTGVVSGRPAAPGRSRVSISASDSAGGSASTSFLWTVEGRPSLRSVSIVRLPHGHAGLSLLVLAGKDAPGLSALRFAVAGINFASAARTLGRFVSVSAPGRRLTARVKLVHGRLSLQLGRSVSSLTVRVSPGAIVHLVRVRSLHVAGSVTDAAGTTDPLQ